MTDGRLQELLRKMPTIAEAVRGLDAVAMRRAHVELLDALAGGADAVVDRANEPSTSAREVPARARADVDEPQPVAPHGAHRIAARETVESSAETIKRESNYLRGEIGAELVNDADHFGSSSVQLLKFHGTYQQDDRDVRAKSAGGKSRKAFMMMVRLRVPGGQLTSSQLLTQINLCEELGNSTLRITTRQTLQMHGVLKRNLKETICRINAAQLTTIASCGDVARNVMCCPAPYSSQLYGAVQDLAQQLSRHLAPQTKAYHEIWLCDSDNGERELVGGSASGAEESLYGAQYLPRKFKVAVGFPHDNCIDIYTHDLGLLAVVRDDQIVGYNVLVGGGMGVTPSAKKTFPALAKRMALIKPHQALDLAAAVVRVQRDFGNRSDRKVARLKYLIHQWGLERFKTRVEEYLGDKLADPEPDEIHGFNDHVGWEAQGDGKWYYGLNVENGRIKDDANTQLKTALREICRTYQPGVRLTAHQSILFTDIDESDREGVEGVFRNHGVTLSHDISTVRRWSMACVAWPTCPLAITEAERALPGIVDEMEGEFARMGLSSEKFTVRMTGCANGCARPYNADIGLVGKAKGKYTVFLGGRLLGNRLNFVYQDLVPAIEIVPTLVPVFAYYKEARLPDETFGDFCNRKGQVDLLAWSENYRALS
ncbi:MAG: NADPH-dependent assimilatory sulfite reductase hemoprotein subunit [Pirellulaceae bacterium]